VLIEALDFQLVAEHPYQYLEELLAGALCLFCVRYASRLRAPVFDGFLLRALPFRRQKP
jgi:hypothetical protein